MSYSKGVACDDATHQAIFFNLTKAFVQYFNLNAISMCRILHLSTLEVTQWKVFLIKKVQRQHQELETTFHCAKVETKRRKV